MDLFVREFGDSAKEYATWYANAFGKDGDDAAAEAANDRRKAVEAYASSVMLAAARAFGSAHDWKSDPTRNFQVVEWV